jgi:tetratricopeptide (TPR) repeat protein
MSAPSIKSSFFHCVLVTLVVGCISSPGFADTRASWVGETLEGKKCLGKSIGFGPYDYLRRANFPAELEVVESAHFTPAVEKLEAGNTATAINDIAYTLMAWPNHHRALHSAMKYRMMFWEWPENTQVPPAECQMQRAMAFSPNDPTPYMMYGLLLHKSKQYEKALFAYRAANSLRPDDVLTLYNMGLTLVELEQYDEAEEVASTVYAAGMPLPGLKNKLIAADHWQTDSKEITTEKSAPQVKLQTPEELSKKAATIDKPEATDNPSPAATSPSR